MKVSVMKNVGDPESFIEGFVDLCSMENEALALSTALESPIIHCEHHRTTVKKA
jgi:hypothetical protein